MSKNLSGKFSRAGFSYFPSSAGPIWSELPRQESKFYLRIDIYRKVCEELAVGYGRDVLIRAKNFLVSEVFET